MNHMELSDELRRQLLESAAWGKAGVAPRLDESETIEEEAILDEAKKPERAKKKKEEEEEKMEESVTHICPLCTSELHESLDSDTIMEHLDVVMALVDRLSQLNEGEEDLDELIDETLADALFGQEEIEEE
jgi:DNA repair exonuclease SbcCD ATPase subunit